MPHRYDTNHIVGQDNLKKAGMDIHHPVFAVASGLVLLFVFGTLLFPSHANSLFDQSKNAVIQNFDWLFIFTGNILVLSCIGLIFSPWAAIKIGGPDAKPDFSRFSWFSMLFAAGMGIGLMFWSVNEPIGYYTNWYGTPLDVAPKTQLAHELALGATMFHWGLHPWSIYAIVGLSLAFFSFNKRLPLTIRSGLYPLLSEHAWGGWGHLIDIVAVCATIFGLATSLGFGAMQAAGGLHYLFDIANNTTTQTLIILAVTTVATISVVRGLDGGVKVLSNANMVMALLLLTFVMFAGPTLDILMAISTTIKSYMLNMIPLSNPVGREDETFYRGWTVFYWAWWISWSPFVGMFIARVSRGRSVREFLIAVLLIPTAVSSVWMAAFGGTALHQVQSGIGALSDGISSVELTLFQMLEPLPFTGITTFFAVLLVLCFFVTSSDSGSLVVDSITAGGKLHAPVRQRIFWAVMEGLIAIALLIGGGEHALGALQAAAITFGLPFCIVLLLMLGCLIAGLRHELQFHGQKSNRHL